MPTIDSLVIKPRKFKRSGYRPWNYMDEMEREEIEKKSDPDALLTEIAESVVIDKTIIAISQESLSTSCDLSSSEISEKSANAISNQALIKDQKVGLESGKAIPIPIFTLADDSFLYAEMTRLTGLQKKLFILIAEQCAHSKNRSTGPINGTVIAESLSTTMKTAKTTMQRLARKNLIIRQRGKPGKEGFYIFSIDEPVKNLFLENRDSLLNWFSIKNILTS